MNRQRPMTKEDDVRETPPELFTSRVAKWGGFDLDAAATPANAKARRFFTEQDNGLVQLWSGRVWINPPFSEMGAWTAKCWAEVAAGRVELIDFLSPATRTEQPWWQKLVEPYRDGRAVLVPGWRLDTDFLPKRPRFLKDGVAMGSPKFGCVMLTWRPVNVSRDR